MGLGVLRLNKDIKERVRDFSRDPRGARLWPGCATWGPWGQWGHDPSVTSPQK